MSVSPKAAYAASTGGRAGFQRSPKISVVIPALNEERAIRSALHGLSAKPAVEVIVVDGGSSDSTAEIAELLGARVIHATGGRAQQMNAGAAVARGEYLIFLHADTRLPPDFETAVEGTLRRPGVIAGAFRLRTDSSRLALRVVEGLANLRSQWLGMPYGDQALFLRRHHFRTAAGFAGLPLMEDFEFVRRIKRWGRVALAPAAVLTSARRWERLGVWHTTFVNQLIIFGYLFGVSPNRLARWYRGGRPAVTSRLPEPAGRAASAIVPRAQRSAHEH